VDWSGNGPPDELVVCELSHYRNVFLWFGKNRQIAAGFIYSNNLKARWVPRTVPICVRGRPSLVHGWMMRPASPEAKELCALQVLKRMSLLPPEKTGGNEMKSKRPTGVAPVLLVLLLFCTAVASVAAEDQVPQPYEENERTLSSDFEIIQISDEIKNSTPYWILLAADEPEQKTVLEWISNLAVPKDEKERMNSFMKDLWEKYPVSLENESNIIHIGFNSENSHVKLTEEENAMLEKVSLAIAEYQSVAYESDSPKWHGGQHWDIIYLSVKKWGYSDELANIAKYAADDPDLWPPIYPPTGWEQFDNFVRLVCHSWDHYYNPSLVTGWAPLRCAEFADSAKTKIDQYNWNGGMNDLGWSSHFITDVGNPLHTGKEIEQGLYPGVHYEYEDYVGSNWETGHNFRDVVDDNWVYHTVYSPDLTTRLLAGFSKNYEDTIFWTMFYYEPEEYAANQNLKAATEACLLSTAQDTLGLVKYVTD